jgi:hypothetical protein
MQSQDSTLLELTIRTLCDVRAEAKADGVFLFSQTKDNQQSVLSAALKIINDGLAGKILMAESDSKSGYPGYSVWEKELLTLGIPKSVILGIDLRKAASLNTLVEAEALIEHAKRNHYKAVYVVASPFHQLRAFMTSVTVALTRFPEVRIYSHGGSPLPWSDRAVHSQGKTTGPRKELIRGEIERIQRYQRKGDLASAIDVLTYLDHRDKRGCQVKAMTAPSLQIS